MEQFQNSTFSFRSNQRPHEVDPGGYIKRGVVYIHSWGSGFQELIFESKEDAGKWWAAECKRLASTEQAGRPGKIR